MNIALFVDIGVVLVLLISAGVSFFRGFIREVLTIFGVLGGAMAAFMFGDDLKPLMASWFGIEKDKDPGKLFDLIPMNLVADVAAYASIFIGVFILLQVISHFLASAVRALGLGPVDRTLGVFFGIGRGILLLGILYLPFSLILPDSKKEWLNDSKTMFFVQETSEWMASYLPQEKDAKAAAETTRDKLKEIDVLGDKRIVPDAVQKMEDLKQQGYDAMDRNNLDKLMDDKSATPPQQGNVNE